MVCETGILSIYSALVGLGAVSTRREFCEQWLGRGESYLRVIRHNGKEPSLEALAACAKRLGGYIGEIESAGASYEEAMSLRNVQDVCSTLINERIYGVPEG